MRERIRAAMEAGRRAVAEAEASRAGPPEVLALLVLDELGVAADALRQRHLEAAKAAGARPLLVLGPLSEHEHPPGGELREALPLPQHLARATGATPDAVTQYLGTRLGLILEKWTVAECRWIGETAAQIVETAADAPGTAPVRFLPAH